MISEITKSTFSPDSIKRKIKRNTEYILANLRECLATVREMESAHLS